MQLEEPHVQIRNVSDKRARPENKAKQYPFRLSVGNKELTN